MLQINYSVMSYGRANIGETVRELVKNIVDDTILVYYNRTGMGGKKPLSITLQECVYSELYLNIFCCCLLYEIKYSDPARIFDFILILIFLFLLLN